MQGAGARAAAGTAAITHRDRLPGSSRYELLVKIASGGMATVYVGRLSSAGGVSRLVAIKRAHAHLLDDASFTRLLVKEARLASRIHHPHVVAVHNVEEVEGELLLVMDYVEGASLAELVGEAHPVPVAVAVRLVLDACSGLHAAHTLEGDDGEPLGIIHRDVSPHNILVGVDGLARITDFGIAKSTDEGTSHARTRTGALKGKLAYMAPEYIESGRMEVRNDVFALGVVAWEAVTNTRLFRAASDVDVMRLVQACEVRRPSELAPSLSAEMDGVLLRALARDPAVRYATAADFGDALERAARQAGLLATRGDVSTFVRGAVGAALMERRLLLREQVGAARPEVEPASEVFIGRVEGTRSVVVRHEATAAGQPAEYAQTVVDPSCVPAPPTLGEATLVGSSTLVLPAPALHLPAAARPVPQRGPNVGTWAVVAGVGAVALAALGLGAVGLSRARTAPVPEVATTQATAPQPVAQPPPALLLPAEPAPAPVADRVAVTPAAPTSTTARPARQTTPAPPSARPAPPALGADLPSERGGSDPRAR